MNSNWCPGVLLITSFLFANVALSDEIETAQKLCRTGKLAPGLYFLTPDVRFDLPENGSKELTYNARGKLLVVPELEEDQDESVWGLTIRTKLGKPDTQESVNISRTAVVAPICDQDFKRSLREAWDGDAVTDRHVPYADYETNLVDRVYEKGRSKNTLKKWHFNASRKESSKAPKGKCFNTRELKLSYQDSAPKVIAWLSGQPTALGALGAIKKPEGLKLSSALVFRSRLQSGCHSIWASTFAGASNDEPKTSVVSLSALKSRKSKWTTAIKWKMQ